VELTTSRLLQFARKLQHAATFRDLLNVAGSEATEALGFAHVWFMVADTEDAQELRLIQVAGERSDVVWDVAPTLKVKGDRFLEALMSADEPVVIYDARVDPRTDKAIVEKLQNRTLINIPLRLLEKPLGLFGLGTFGDEGCRQVTDAELGYLVGMASQIAVAASRIRFLESQAYAERERRELERRLLQIQKLESLGMLAGGIAHDFNNLLTVIMASAGLAQQLSNTEDLSAEIDAVLGAAKRASDLTRQLLAMSREQELSLRPLDMNGQLSQLLDLARRVLPENISIDLIEGHGLPLVEGDSSQIDQVFMNLFVNARDAMAEGGRLTVETEQVLINGRYTEAHPWARAGRYVLVTVTDTGTGMPREVLDRVFEPFFTTKGTRKGTGLGLAVAYGIVRQHRGMLHCYSEVGVGTTFKIYLPAVERLASEVGTKLQAMPVLGEERILVAEDDELVRGVAVRILERAGYRVVAVEDGDAACRAISRAEFDLVLLDVVMPGMPCRDVIERILTFDPRARILLSSGYTAGANVAALTTRTGFELLRKPYDPDQMLIAVRRTLDSNRPPPAK
ncbi:MAG TPA: ATP-binding protein, partial [Polyangiaceae bacterium]|nr:ATP-binding protein [Polyangiaceae bacterium]